MNDLCPICLSKAAFAFNTSEVGEVYFCSNLFCEHSFAPTQISAKAGICKLTSDPVLLKKKADSEHAFFRLRNRILFDQIRQYLKLSRDVKDAEVNILDIGAGPACFSRDLSTLCMPNRVKVTCLEANTCWHPFYDDMGFKVASSLQDLNSYCGYDFVIMAEVIEHLADPVGFLRLLRPNLKSDCTVFLTTPMGWRVPTATNAYQTQSHLHFFSPESLDIALFRAGYYPLRAERFNMMPPRGTIAKEAFHRVVAGAYAFVDSLGKPAPPSHKGRHSQSPERRPHSIHGVTGVWQNRHSCSIQDK